MIFLFIRDYNSGNWTIEVMCKVLKVSRSSYYAWLKDPEGTRARKYKKLDEEIRTCYIRAKDRNSSPRLAKDLQAEGFLFQDQQWHAI